MNPAHDVHSAYDATKRGKTLAIWISLSAEIQSRLVADADEDVVLRGVWAIARHRERAVLMSQPGISGALQRVGREELTLPRRIGPRLDHLNLELVAGLVA